MIYELTHAIQDSMPWVWNYVEGLNSEAFYLRYKKALKELSGIIEKYDGSYRICEAGENDVTPLADFFSRQPEESFRYFQPHAFDEKTLLKLMHRKSFLMYVVKDGDVIVGYFFLRSFFIGKTFLGKMVDTERQGHGIGKMMCSCAMDIAERLGLRMYETISKENIASLYSTQKVLEVRIIEEMPNGYLYIEDVHKKPIG